MSRTLSLQDLLAVDDEALPVTLRMTVRTLAPPTLKALRQLKDLGLLDDEIVLSLVGQAPIDPIGLYEALRDSGTWAFSALDFTVIQVLAKKRDKPVAAMRIDLLSDDLTFIVLRDGKLVEHSTKSGEELAALVVGRTLRTWLDEATRAVIEEGFANSQ